MENIKVEIIEDRKHLTPAPGHRLCNGKGTYPKYVILAVGADESAYSAITEAEYEEIMRAELEKEALHG